MTDRIRRMMWTCALLAALLAAGGGRALADTAAPAATAPASQPATATSDWPQWRGPNRDGVAVNSPKLLDAWPKGGPPILWKSDAIPCMDDPKAVKEARAGGAGSPVVAGGRVFVYADCTSQFVVTSKMLEEWGWLDGVPDDLATKIETARNSAGNHKGADLDKHINEFLATLDAAQAQKFGEHIRKRVKLGAGEGAAGWWGMTTLVGAGARDKEYPSFTEWEKINYKGKSFTHGSLVNGHGDGGSGGNYIANTVLRECKHTDTVFCLDAGTGKTLWKAEFPGHGDKDAFSTPASGTPAISNDKCYVAGSAGVYCLSVKDGKVLWKTKAQFTHSSPLVAKGLVYVLFNPPDGLTALNAETGQLVWRQPKLWNLFSSPALWTGKDGKNALVCYAFGAGASLVDPKTGEILCPFPGAGPEPWGHFSSPVVSGDTVVFLCGGRLTGFRIDYPKAEKLWSLQGVAGGRGNSPVVYQGYAYSLNYYWSDCVDIKTGERKWKGSKTALSHETPSPVIADGKVFTHDGGNSLTLWMLKASPDVHDVILGETPDLSCCYSSPAIAGGRMYIRGANNVICYDLAPHGP